MCSIKNIHIPKNLNKSINPNSPETYAVEDSIEPSKRIIQPPFQQQPNNQKSHHSANVQMINKGG
jgi:hypothetical protein